MAISRLVKRRVVALSAQMEAALRRLQSTEQTLRREAMLLMPHMKMPLVPSSLHDACLTLMNGPDIKEFGMRSALVKSFSWPSTLAG